MKCEHCGKTGNVKKVVIGSNGDDYIYLCGACREDKRTKEYKDRK